MTDLMDAAFSGDLERLRVAIERADDPNAPDARGWTALTFAVLGCHPEAARLLLAAGADPNREARDGSTALMKASLWGDAATVAVLLAHGANRDAIDADGWTAERIAATKGHDDIARLLMNTKPTSV